MSTSISLYQLINRRKRDFKELVHVVMRAGKCEIRRAAGRLEIQVRIDVAV